MTRNAILVTWLVMGLLCPPAGRANVDQYERAPAGAPPLHPGDPMLASGSVRALGMVMPRAVEDDGSLGDGWEPAVRVVGGKVVALFTPLVRPSQGPDVPFAFTSQGSGSPWLPSTFPLGTEPFVGRPGDVWIATNPSSGEVFASVRRSDTSSGNLRTTVARSVDGGTSWTLLHEVHADEVDQSRGMLDVDRSFGDVGSGRLYLTYNTYSREILPSGDYFLGSYLRVLTATGAVEREVQISRPVPEFHGSSLQPVVANEDGHFFLMGEAITIDQPWERRLVFHEGTAAGAAIAERSIIKYPTAGQPLDDRMVWGVNGHNIDHQGIMAIDRRDGTLYVAYNANPHQDDPHLDQGDIQLARSIDNAQTWTILTVPTEAGKTQFFPMMHVAANGWVHVAYYQNETGVTDGGVVDASTANVYYALSKDGGSTWSAARRLNEDADTLRYDDPPPDRVFSDYNLLGEYQQLTTEQTDQGTRVHVCWTTYDRERATNPGYPDLTKSRVICSTVTHPSCGDGVLDAVESEVCDDGNASDADCCTSACQFADLDFADALAALPAIDGGVCGGRPLPSLIVRGLKATHGLVGKARQKKASKRLAKILRALARKPGRALESECRSELTSQLSAAGEILGCIAERRRLTR